MYSTFIILIILNIYYSDIYYFLKLFCRQPGRKLTLKTFKQALPLTVYEK